MLTIIRKSSLTLAFFAFLSTGLVVITQYLTKHPIEQRVKEELLSTLNQIIPSELYDNNLYDSCTFVMDPLLGTNDMVPAYLATLKGQPTALTIEAVAPDGYNGKINIIVAVKVDGTITGIRVLSHQETPGLGDKIDLHVTNWILNFTGKKVNKANLWSWKIGKGNKIHFDEVVGATITSRAVIKAVKNAALYLDQNKENLFNQPFNCGGSYGIS
ncbi:electron transport complex protein [Candidatus Photodesmus katoptron]|uniref:Ion-translocating oxidoreductase complex subunit G n=1 Tax=Candidatus Photodesmus katoptron Akat1 TaxID=1236703 RepID=S3DKJ8_9GAMM|nr:electron transport complex subunit RsxG [Candidatus Photodesmus katoptron]EPE37654.1 electron transport complex, RnfABCDGE type, G subunit [Candidatus Photodesmus katoptron Akat1]KEY90626.1 electron transport complex protein [Candidatus Photodesmus katoptron]